jgi:hypothetical protein
MTKQQRIRFEMGAAARLNAAGTTARHDDFQIIRNKYDLSTAGVGGTHAKAIFVGPGPRTS